MLDSDEVIEVVGDVMRQHVADLKRLIEGARIKSIEDAGAGRVVVVLGDGTTFPVNLSAGPRGEPGLDGKDGKDGANGNDGKDGAQGLTGERGADGVGIEGVEADADTPDAFTLRFTNGEAVAVQLPRGPAGERGERGTDGADRFVIAPRRIREGEPVAKNDLVYWAGGIVQCARATTHDPANDPASYVPIINGIEAVRIVENFGTRTYDITARLTDGTEVVERVAVPPRFMATGPRPGERIIRGDQFLRGDWLFTATLDGADPANTDSPGWRRQSLHGKRGERGEPGERGPAGVGIVDVDVVDGVIAVKLSTGEEKFFPVAEAAE